MVELQVIYDSGQSVPASPYLGYLIGQPDAAHDGHAGDEVMQGLRFPIVSRLKPGLLDRERKVFDARWLTQPVFIVGADARSLRWLRANRTRLNAISAWGLVAQAASNGDFRGIQAIAPELRYAPSVGHWLDDHLMAAGVAVYPLLIDTGGVARQRLADERYGPVAGKGTAP
jgi:integrating conjugative element protein (TIGR03765 family)